jgi:hypothetical protein
MDVSPFSRAHANTFIWYKSVVQRARRRLQKRRRQRPLPAASPLLYWAQSSTSMSFPPPRVVRHSIAFGSICNVAIVHPRAASSPASHRNPNSVSSPLSLLCQPLDLDPGAQIYSFNEPLPVNLSRPDRIKSDDPYSQSNWTGIHLLQADTWPISNQSVLKQIQIDRIICKLVNLISLKP